MFQDYSESGCLDFLPVMQKKMVHLVKGVFSAADEIVYFSGIPAYGHSFFKEFMRCVPEEIV